MSLFQMCTAGRYRQPVKLASASVGSSIAFSSHTSVVSQHTSIKVKGHRGTPVIRKNISSHDDTTEAMSWVYHWAPDSISCTIRAANEKALQRTEITWHGAAASSSLGAIIYKNNTACDCNCESYVYLVNTSQWPPSGAVCSAHESDRWEGNIRQILSSAPSEHLAGQGKWEQVMNGWGLSQWTS